MLKRMFLCQLMILAIVVVNMPVSRAQTLAAQGPSIKLSTYRDDPFVDESYIGRMNTSSFDLDQSGHPFLSNNRVSLLKEDFIYRQNPATNEYEKFALNPWPEAVSNGKGNFKFADEARFPPFEIERDADGKPVLKDGLQVWKKRDLHLGLTTAFTASNDARDAAEVWAGRDLPWGVDNVLDIESQIFIDFNAFYSGSTRSLFFGVVPYRLPGETQIKMFETATSWEMVAHEAGHAVHHVLKPNADATDLGFNTFGESFGDQVAMWASLRDPQRVRGVLAETSGDLYKSNSLTRNAEAFAALVGHGTGIRDAFHDKKISDTGEEVHDRSEVFSGAAYKVFTLIYDDLKSNAGLDERAAVTEAGDIMGVFLIHSMDFTPENSVTLEDIGKAYLKVDKELYGGRYQNMFANEFTMREIFNADSVGQWKAHEASLPDLQLPRRASNRSVEKLVKENLDSLGIGPDFGLKLQSITRDDRFGLTLVRVQLTDGRGGDAALFENHGILIFRADGTLADYYSPFPSGETTRMQSRTGVQALSLVNQAKRMGLNHRGALLSIVSKLDGGLTVEARVMRSKGFYCWVEAFTLEHTEGERREIITPQVPGHLSGVQPSGVQILTMDDLKN